MKDRIEKLISKYNKVIYYFMCSAFTAVLEVVLGWVLLKIVPFQILITNTIAVMFSALIHYLITLKVVFKKENNYKRVFVYIITFLIGLALQNSVIWICYSKIFDQSNELIRYFVSKMLSLGIPFVVMYKLRSILNEKIN